jgi:hypothetical protein
LQNIFCVVRGRNGYNSRPEATAFKTAIRAVVLSNLFRPLNNNYNCENDSATLLLDVLESAACGFQKGFKSALKQASATTTVRLFGGGSELCGIDFEEEEVFSVGDEEGIINRPEIQVVEMLGGYCVTQLFRQQKLKCSACKEQLLKTQRNILLQEREYRECTSQALFSSSLVSRV